MIHCPSCGAIMQDGQKFCAKCGAQVSSPTPPLTPVTPNQSNYGNPGNAGAQGGYGNPGGYNGYANPGGYGAPGGFPTRGGGTPVSFQQKNIAVCIILSIVTCGIYGIIWFIDMVNNLNEASGNQNANSGGTVFLFGILTCGIYLFIWMYKAGEQVNIAKGSRGLPVDSNSGVMYLLLTVFGLGIVAYALIQSELNHIAELYGAPPA